jgi:hypothetical protein
MRMAICGSEQILVGSASSAQGDIIIGDIIRSFQVTMIALIKVLTMVVEIAVAAHSVAIVAVVAHPVAVIAVVVVHPVTVVTAVVIPRVAAVVIPVVASVPVLVDQGKAASRENQ